MWEYKIIDLQGDHEQREGLLLGLGNLGWELVSVCVQFTTHTAYLKRRR